VGLTGDHDAHFSQHGYAIVEGFVSPDVLDQARSDLRAYFPTAEEYEGDPQKYAHLVADPFAGLREGPFSSSAINNLATDPEVVDFVARHVGTRDLWLTQHGIGAKYPAAVDYDQPLHMDYPSHTLTVPRDDSTYLQVEFLVYLSDVTVDLGPTYVVSSEVTRDLPLWPPALFRETHPEVYAREIPIAVPAGSAFVYTPATFHRGSAMTARTGARFATGFAYRASSWMWMGFKAWARDAVRPEFAAFIEQATPEQRGLLGFPSPGHDFWNEATLAGVAARYPNMDMGPYLRDVEES
jgi:ectoine hydroxylase-related dioxygenase (phytanoyl-CoA dioxygenase family)